jgi:dUTP pyrophosphatase
MNHLEDNLIRSVYTSLKGKYYTTVNNFAILKVAISDAELLKKYESHAGDHNKKVMTNYFADSGFDILLPDDTVFDSPINKSQFVDFQLKTEMLYCDVERDYVTNTPFLIHPRSSISKTPLMLANHTGVIDSGYRGSLIGAFRYLGSDDNSIKQTVSNTDYAVSQYTQIGRAHV